MLRNITSMSTKLYIGNLSLNTTENELQVHFAQAGTVRETMLPQDTMTGKPRGFGFVTMSSEEEARKAIRLLDGKDFMSCSLTVSDAYLRGDRTGGGPRRNISISGDRHRTGGY